MRSDCRTSCLSPPQIPSNCPFPSPLPAPSARSPPGSARKGPEPTVTSARSGPQRSTPARVFATNRLSSALASFRVSGAAWATIAGIDVVLDLAGLCGCFFAGFATSGLLPHAVECWARGLNTGLRKVAGGCRGWIVGLSTYVAGNVCEVVRVSCEEWRKPSGPRSCGALCGTATSPTGMSSGTTTGGRIGVIPFGAIVASKICNQNNSFFTCNAKIWHIFIVDNNYTRRRRI